MTATATPTATTDSDDEARDFSHVWVGSAIPVMDDKRAKHANLRGSYRTIAGEKVDVLEVYCRECRRPYEDVADAVCAARVDKTHLIGGNPGERKKRKEHPAPAGSVIERGPAMTRQGVSALVNGGAVFIPDRRYPS